MDILSNELVKKYFGYELTPMNCGLFNEYSLDVLARRVLRSMQEPIKKGERFIYISTEGKIDECTFTISDQFHDLFHPQYLRLPDRFQKQCEDTWRECPQCKQRFSWHEQPKPSAEKCATQASLKEMENIWIGPKPKDPVEEKIQELADKWKDDNVCAEKQYYVEHLRELVELAIDDWRKKAIRNSEEQCRKHG